MNFRSFYSIFFFKDKQSQCGLINNSLLLTGLLCCLSCECANAQSDIENIEQLRIKVAQFLTDEYNQSKASKVEVKVGTLDDRLRLAQCNQKLALTLQDTIHNGGNINVQVECKGSSHWTILVPALAIVYRPVAVANRNLQRGDIVTSGDITLDVKDMSGLRIGFVLEPENIAGKEIKFPMNKGEAFRTSVLDAPLVIKRGEEVTVEAIAGGIKVLTTGTAVTDGRLGQQMRVKNNQSERIVTAKVVGPGRVQNLL